MSSNPQRPDATMQIVPGRNASGEGVFSVIVKRSYRIVPGADAQRLGVDQPLRRVDQYQDNGDPQWATVEHESELAPFKAASDLVVIGRAYAPQGQATASMTVGILVGDRKKLLRVSGDRVCHWRSVGDPVFGDPDPFTEMPVSYDRAYGGRDERSQPDIPFFYPRNDMGKGVVLGGAKAVVQGLALPNIEDPADLLTPERLVIGDPYRWKDQPLPQGLGWRQRSWYPRSALLGSLPPFLRPGDVTAEERLGLLPPDHVSLARQSRLPPFEARFANGASLGLTFAKLHGDEDIALRGLTPSGTLDFRLSGDWPTITLDTGAGADELEAAIHTVSIRPDALELDIVWRAAKLIGSYTAMGRIQRLEAQVQ
jgi:hypothetical protein